MNRMVTLLVTCERQKCLSFFCMNYRDAKDFAVLRNFDKYSKRVMKTYTHFLSEAQKRLRFINVYRGDSEKVAKDIKANRNTQSSEYGVYGPGVYASDRYVARHYAADSGNNPNTNIGVTRSRIPVTKIKNIRTPEHNSPEGIQRSREIVYGNPGTTVRIKNAASQQERRRHPNKNGESDYFVVNQDTFNKGITTTPIIQKPRIPKRFQEESNVNRQQHLSQLERDIKSIQNNPFTRQRERVKRARKRQEENRQKTIERLSRNK